MSQQYVMKNDFTNNGWVRLQPVPMKAIQVVTLADKAVGGIGGGRTKRNEAVAAIKKIEQALEIGKVSVDSARFTRLSVQTC